MVFVHFSYHHRFSSLGRTKTYVYLNSIFWNISSLGVQFLLFSSWDIIIIICLIIVTAYTTRRLSITILEKSCSMLQTIFFFQISFLRKYLILYSKSNFIKFFRLARTMISLTTRPAACHIFIFLTVVCEKENNGSRV